MGVSILQPQYVWFWAFTGISIFKISAGIAIIAWFIQMIRGKVNWQIYNNGIFYGMFILLIVFQLSDLLSPFSTYVSRVSSTLVLDIYSTIFVMFFITLGLMNSENAVKSVIAVVVAVTIYYTYWANNAYFSGLWQLFESGRLAGPSGSPYRDGNAFSILFVIGLPFILFGIYQVDKKWQKLLLIIAIPLIWHALVLCASRGAMLSAGVSTIVAALKIRSKAFNIVLVLGFVVFVIDQGGAVISRTVETVQRAESSQDAPINPRIVSWTVGLELIKKHPVLGVGPQRFLQASGFYFPGKSRHVAHNTFLNFAANTGLIAGFTYLSFFWIARKMYKSNKQALEKNPNKFHTYVNKAGICSLIGFFVGAIFLDLIIFEPFYLLLLILVANNFVIRERAIASDQVTESDSGAEISQQSKVRMKRV
jgi:O-antigen ligase